MWRKLAVRQFLTKANRCKTHLTYFSNVIFNNSITKQNNLCHSILQPRRASSTIGKLNAVLPLTSIISKPTSPHIKRTYFSQSSTLLDESHEAEEATPGNVSLTGCISRIVHHNKESGWVVMKVKCKNERRLQTVVGTLPSATPGEYVVVSQGKYKSTRFGHQLEAKNLTIIEPTEINEIEEYLSVCCKGIGPSKAKALVQQFGKDVLQIIQNEPEKLTAVPGIGATRAQLLSNTLKEKKLSQEVLTYLLNHNINTNFGTQIWRAFGEQSIEVVEENPYQLIKAIRGFSFRDADKLAKALGFQSRELTRIEAGINHVLYIVTSNGHCYYPTNLLVQRTAKLLKIPTSVIYNSINLFITSFEEDQSIVCCNSENYSSPVKEVKPGDRIFTSSVINNSTSTKSTKSKSANPYYSGFTNNKDSNNNNDDSDASLSEYGAYSNAEVEPSVAEAKQDDNIFLTYPQQYYIAESECVKKIDELLKTQSIAMQALKVNIESEPFSEEWRANIASKYTDTTLSHLQKEAVLLSLSKSFLIITGGPGVGKTRAVKSILEAHRSLVGTDSNDNDNTDNDNNNNNNNNDNNNDNDNNNLNSNSNLNSKKKKFKFALAAPTGRAASRLEEVSGFEAATVHRLLECDASRNFARNEDNPLDASLIIVDEVSMLDITLAHAILKATPKNATLVFVGDVDQLPSIGPGCILLDLISSKKIPTIALTEVFRQKSGSDIISAAHHINKGGLPNNWFDNSINMIINDGNNADISKKEFLFIKANTPSEVIKSIINLTAQIPKQFKDVSSFDVQVLTPMVNGGLGARYLTKLLQEQLNPPMYKKRELKKYGITYREGDKIMQLANDYDKNVYNGEMGLISEVDIVEQQQHDDNTLEKRRESSLIATFDASRNEISYSASELESLMPSYAITIHKSQGSEFPVVIIPVHMEHKYMLQRNLLYTAVTRARKLVVLVGTKEAVLYASQRKDMGTPRFTGLKGMLKEQIVSS